MKKLLVCTSVLAALGLTGCGGETIDDIRAETEVVTPITRVVFDPAAGNLNVPNDLLMLPGDDGFFDYTLNIPVADPTDFGDPQNALNVLDGWSTTAPFQINFTTAAGVSIDASTMAQGIRIFESTLGLDVRDPQCGQITVPSAGCKIGDELVVGVDFALMLADDDTVNVVPLRPLKGAQGYTLVVTSALQDSSGNPVRGSTTWDLVKQDIDVNPLATPSQLSLQGLINTHIDALETAGLTRDEISYAAAFTTLSTTSVMSAIKQLHVTPFAQTQNPAALPAIAVTNQSADMNAMETLGVVSQSSIDDGIAVAVENTPELQALAPLIPNVNFSSLTTCNGLLAAAGGQFTVATGQTFGAQADAGLNALAQGVSQETFSRGAGPLCSANVYEGTVSLPYFLAIPRADNPAAPGNEFWRAMCDSGVVLAGAPDEVLAMATPGPNDATCQVAGLRDLMINGEPLDKERQVTRFNPLPKMNGGNQGRETLDVQVTVPNPTFAGALGFDVQMPEGGWPVVMLVHGITSKKEDMLAISGALSLAGFATVAIDQPLHGTRGFDVDPTNPGDEINATTVSATAFLNLASLPTARDNSRQAVSDLLGVRLGLNAFVNATGNDLVTLNGTDVSVMGVSLGAITGGNFAAIANTPFDGQLEPLSGMFSVQVASLESPGGGITQFLLESPTFGPLIKAFLLQGGSEDFQAFLGQLYPDGNISEAQLVGAYTQFVAALTPEQLAAANALFAQFAFAAQSVIDSSDPINFFEILGENTPVHMMTVVGDGGDNLPDQVIPVSTTLPTSGQLPLANLMGLQDIVSTVPSQTPISGIVKFIEGAHASSLSPAASAAVTAEMQNEVATYMATKGTVIQVTNEDVVQN
ncbi:VolA/Pla-1 family phospholipase [Glaciecola sp. 1036]|uniref:VolA/Pla-1 family phospholipase n=1 Tax=Alteromonadaceae TaxID=72275 RepID=UPI003D013094